MRRPKSKCSHLAVARIRSKDVICAASLAKKYCLSMARLYWVGVGRPPGEEVEKFLKLFKKNPYCPKCGAKLNFDLCQ